MIKSRDLIENKVNLHALGLLLSTLLEPRNLFIIREIKVLDCYTTGMWNVGLIGGCGARDYIQCGGLSRSRSRVRWLVLNVNL